MSRYGRSIERKARTGSTNDDARAAAERGVPDGHVIVADAQDAGRGSHGRAWSSPPGTDLYLSIVAQVPLEPAKIPPLTLAVGLGVARAAEELAGAPAAIKWPNDVWIGERKCAGILVETTSVAGRMGPVVIGIGLHVNRREWPPELATAATSLALVRGEDVDRERALGVLLAHVEAAVDRFVAGGPTAITREVEARLLWRGETVWVGNLAGELVGLAPSGALRLREARSREIMEIVSGTLTRTP